MLVLEEKKLQLGKYKEHPRKELTCLARMVNFPFSSSSSIERWTAVDFHTASWLTLAMKCRVTKSYTLAISPLSSPACACLQGVMGAVPSKNIGSQSKTVRRGSIILPFQSKMVYTTYDGRPCQHRPWRHWHHSSTARTHTIPIDYPGFDLARQQWYQTTLDTW